MPSASVYPANRDYAWLSGGISNGSIIWKVSRTGNDYNIGREGFPYGLCEARASASSAGYADYVRALSDRYFYR